MRTPMPVEGVTIFKLDGARLPPETAARIDDIFFEASGRNGFASPQERAAFRERWLGRYLKGGTDVLILARDRAQSGPGAVAGYLVGALEDPGSQERFADIGYFRAGFRALCRRYPAHLHINLAPAYRSCGIGARLIAAFSAHAAASGAPGLHVVTAKGARNVGFYARCGLAEAGATCWNGRDVVFLAKPLEAGRPRD